MVTLTTVLADVKDRIGDSTGKNWSDAMLTRWINDAMRDIARRGETLEDIISVAVTAGTSEYTLATNIFRLHRVEFQISTTNKYVLEARTISELDSIWGSNQLQQQYAPSYYAVWGAMGVNAKIYVYPNPSQNATLKLWCYRLPATVSGSEVCEIAVGWEDLIPLFCEYVALRRDSDDRWRDAKSLYEESLANMINLTRQHHDQPQWIVRQPVGIMPWSDGGY